MVLPGSIAFQPRAGHQILGSALQTETIRTSKTLVTTYTAKRHHNQQELNRNIIRVVK
jgi:hypothetical protein